MFGNNNSDQKAYKAPPLKELLDKQFKNQEPQMTVTQEPISSDPERQEITGGMEIERVLFEAYFFKGKQIGELEEIDRQKGEVLFK